MADLEISTEELIKTVVVLCQDMARVKTDVTWIKRMMWVVVVVSLAGMGVQAWQVLV